MARSLTSKIKIERDRKNTILATTPIAHDIIAGKFTDQDWLWMLDRDDSDSFIVDLVNDIYTAADKIIYEKYIEDQLIPYTVLQAKDALLQIVEWQFLARDEDSTNMDPFFWIEDSEPRTAVTDCWAQGAVPLTFRSPTPISEEMENAGKLQSPRYSEKVAEDDEVCSPRSGLRASDNICSPVTFEQNEVCAPESEICDRPCDSKGQSPVSESPFKMPEPPPFACDDSTEKQAMVEEGLGGREADCKVPDVPVVKQQALPHDIASEVCGQSLVAIDECNKDLPSKTAKCEDVNIDVYIAKIPPSRLPSNRVNTVYCIIDPKQEAAKVRSDVLRARKKMPQGETSIAQKTTTGQNSSVAKVKVANSDVTIRQAESATRFPLLLDSMQIAPGVTARERDVVKRGPKIDSSRVDVPSDLVLRPVRAHNPHPTVNVSDLLDQHVRVKPLAEPNIVPPIGRSPFVASH